MSPSGVSGDSDHGFVKLALPPEIVDLIITDYTNALEDRRPIKRLLLVSRLFYSLYAPSLYESSYLTDSDEDVPREHAPSTVLAPHHLSELQIALSANTGLPKFVQTFSSQTTTPPPNIQSTEIPPKNDAVNSSHPQLALDAILAPHLPQNPAIFTISFLFSGLPNLLTLEGDQDAFRRVRLAEFPGLEHIIVQMSTTLFLVTNEDILRRLRTLYITCKPHENLFVLLRALERIEDLFTGIGDVASIKYSPLPTLLDIPSKGLKYISLQQIRFYDNSFIVDRLFNAHPNLVIVDVCPTRTGTSKTKLLVDRYVRLGENGEPNGFGVLKRFRVPEPKIFESCQWEVREIRDDVEEARVNGTSYLERRRTGC
ncbi:hypothetical protein ONZ45_g13359 [Pleurotus djamor]|nr:hypothetical protein ONZ45_g13359 [Pleurotus djamor]